MFLRSRASKRLALAPVRPQRPLTPRVCSTCLPRLAARNDTATNYPSVIYDPNIKLIFGRISEARGQMPAHRGRIAGDGGFVGDKGSKWAAKDWRITVPKKSENTCQKKT